MTSLKFSYSLKLLKESIKQNRHIIIMHTILLLLATILPAQIAIADLAERVKEYYPTILNMRADYTYLISGFSAFTIDSVKDKNALVPSVPSLENCCW